jgi:ribosomal small subunit protein bTHX
MGRGDRRSRKGKTTLGSNGKSRPAKKTKMTKSKVRIPVAAMAAEAK